MATQSVEAPRHLGIATERRCVRCERVVFGANPQGVCRGCVVATLRGPMREMFMFVRQAPAPNVSIRWAASALDMAPAQAYRICSRLQEFGLITWTKAEPGQPRVAATLRETRW